MKINVQYIDTSSYTVGIDYEYCPDSPLSWTTPEERGAWFALKHNRYDLPMEIDFNSDDFGSWQEAAKTMTTVKGYEMFGKVYKFVNWYEHSDVTVSLSDSDTPSDRWDAGIAGIIFGDSEADIEAAFADWKLYTEGEVYMVDITAANGENIETCGGIYGDDGVKAFIDQVIPGYQRENINVIGEASFIL